MMLDAGSPGGGGGNLGLIVRAAATALSNSLRLNGLSIVGRPLFCHRGRGRGGASRVLPTSTLCVVWCQAQD